MTRERPDAPAIVVKQRLDHIIRKSICLTEHGALSIVPPHQTIVSGDPNAPIGGSEHRHSQVAGRTLLGRNRSDGEFSKAVEPSSCADPDIAFTILEKTADDLA